MIRILCRNVDLSDAAAGVGPTEETYKTFDVELPELEKWLRESSNFVRRTAIGIEVVEP